MGVAVGLLLIAFGAILTWGVEADVNGLDVTAVGVILLVVGIIVCFLDFFWWRTWEWTTAAGPRRRATYVREQAVQPVQPVQTTEAVQPVQPVAPARRRVVVDEREDGPVPPGPPPP